MSVNIGTVSQYGSAFSPQRKILKTSSGKLVLFAYLGDGVGYRIQYKTSDDNGATWSSWNDISFGRDIREDLWSFDIQIDSSDNIHVFAADTSTNGYYEKLTYSSGTWSNGTPTYIMSGARRSSILIKSNDDIWIFSYYNTLTDKYYVYSTNGGASWSGTQTLTGAAGCFGLKAIEVGSDIWIIYSTSGSKLQYRIYNGSWGSETDIASITNAVIGVGKVSDSEIYAAAQTSSGIKVYVYTSSWDSGTLISDNTNDNSANIGIINSKPVIIWKDYDGSNYNIVYRSWTGSTWATAVKLTDDSSLEEYPIAIEEDSDYLYATWITGSGAPYTMYFDTVLLNPTKQQTITSDAHIKSVNNQQTITSDANITGTKTQTINSDAHIQAIDVQETILSDARIVDRYSENINSDAHIQAIDVQETILSDAYIAELVTYDTENKINFVKRVFIDILSDARMVKKIFKDISNKISSVISTLYNINNDFRTKKIVLSNIKNDMRMICSWQKSASFGFQSLGKSYIHVYIDSVDQTDADIDSISIYKALNTSHSASFDLIRKYDSTKPDIEALVEIKYHIWTLYKGYITAIKPSDTPESMRIECQDEYWKNNRNNQVYFYVGHEPDNETETYYETINNALLNEFSWSVDLGNFVPEVIDCFGDGYSDAISKLIEQSGNFAWYYDENFDKKIWEAGAGSIININRQAIGVNIDLYQLIEHNFTDDVSSIINKYRVQMGEKVIKKASNAASYSSYYYTSYEAYAVPAWNSNYEVLAKNSVNGYGVDYHKPEQEYLYQDIYKKYELPFLDSESESWTDWKPPEVHIYGSNLFNAEEGLLESGYTIDYEKGLLILNDRIYSYSEDDQGKLSSIRAPIIKVNLWKKKTISHNTESEDPTALSFVTSKVGDYPTTIESLINLSNFSIQEGYTYYESGQLKVVPSWDDTDFAEDYIYWQLSNSAYKKINGTIVLTLDSVCFNNIKLSDRIYIDGITEEAMNINSISYDIGKFQVTIELQNHHSYKRTVSMQNHNEYDSD